MSMPVAIYLASFLGFAVFVSIVGVLFALTDDRWSWVAGWLVLIVGEFVLGLLIAANWPVQT